MTGDEFMFAQPRYTFGTFMTDSTNANAYLACVVASKDCGRVHNPLVIRSEHACGKTHLLCAVANELSLSRALYLSAEELSSDLVYALTNGIDIKAYYESLTNFDAVLIDDGEYLCGREQTAAEFIRLFEYLCESGVQVVFASSGNSKELDVIENFAVNTRTGKVCTLSYPGNALKREYLVAHTSSKGVNLDEKTIRYVVDGVTDLRSLKGCITKLLFFLDVNKADERIQTSVI